MAVADEWKRWWDEALEHEAVCNHLLSHQHWSSSIFRALMAMELASKSMRVLPPNYGDLEKASYGALEKHSYGELSSGVKPTKDHKLETLLDIAWLGPFEKSSGIHKLRSLYAKLPGRVSTSHDLYLACRYPDKWPSGETPSKVFGQRDAEVAKAAMLDFLQLCRDRLQERALA